MKTLAVFLLLSCAALAEEAPCVPIPNGTGSAGSCAVQPVQPHLAPDELLNYFRKLSGLQAASKALEDKQRQLPEFKVMQKAQEELDEASAPLISKCGGADKIAPDAAKGLDCAKVPEKPAEKK